MDTILLVCSRVPSEILWVQTLKSEGYGVVCCSLARFSESKRKHGPSIILIDFNLTESEILTIKGFNCTLEVILGGILPAKEKTEQWQKNLGETLHFTWHTSPNAKELIDLIQSVPALA